MDEKREGVWHCRTESVEGSKGGGNIHNSVLHKRLTMQTRRDRLAGN